MSLCLFTVVNLATFRKKIHTADRSKSSAANCRFSIPSWSSFPQILSRSQIIELPNRGMTVMNAIVIFTSSKQEQRTLVFLGEVRLGRYMISQERATAHAAFLGFHLHDYIPSLMSSVSSYRRL